MKLLIACLLVLASASAHATDYLSVHSGGTDTEYTGSIVHLETEGLGGTVILNAMWPGQTSSFDEDGPQQTGTWHMIVRQDDGTSTDTTMQCAARISMASTCSTLRLNCVQAASGAIRPTK